MYLNGVTCRVETSALYPYIKGETIVVGKKRMIVSLIVQEETDLNIPIHKRMIRTTLIATESNNKINW